MKKKFFLPIAFLMMLIVSCSSEESTIDQTANLTLDIALSEIISQTENSENPIDFEISFLANDQVMISEANIVENNFVDDFSKGFSLSNNNQQRTTVCCNDVVPCTECDNNDGGCIGAAVKACLDEDGCAEVCNQRIRYVPSLKSFYISK